MNEMLGDEKSLMSEDRATEFLTKRWGGCPHEWAKKYWRGMNAFNTNQEGVSADDYVECWILWDTKAFEDFYAEAKQSDYRFNPENPNKPKGADWILKRDDIVKDVFSHWSGQKPND